MGICTYVTFVWLIIVSLCVIAKFALCIHKGSPPCPVVEQYNIELEFFDLPFEYVKIN